ncbi:hypothetical protein GQ53DRAFT_751340 [Thozetella sp. PMI_491]|nr:hypothetical protein GQ53DRAFT_751340 [Thozetella sp. PMI_491]
MKRQATPAEWTRWKLCTSIFSDLLTVVGTGLTVYQACTLTQYDARVHMGVGLWVYPSLPVALIGLCLLAGERWFPRTYPGNCLLLALTVAVLAGAGGSIAYLLSKYDAASNHLWVLSLICYILMIMPLIALRWLIIPASAIIWFARVGGVSVAALGHYSGGQPYCHFQGIGFAVVYMVMGGIAAVLGSFGAFYHLNRAMKAHKQ